MSAIHCSLFYAHDEEREIESTAVQCYQSTDRKPSVLAGCADSLVILDPYFPVRNLRNSFAFKPRLSLRSSFWFVHYAGFLNKSLDVNHRINEPLRIRASNDCSVCSERSTDSMLKPLMPVPNISLTSYIDFIARGRLTPFKHE